MGQRDDGSVWGCQRIWDKEMMEVFGCEEIWNKEVMEVSGCEEIWDKEMTEVFGCQQIWDKEVMEVFGCQQQHGERDDGSVWLSTCLLYTSPSPRDRHASRMPSSA